MKILIASTQNPKGRTLVQEDNAMGVLSECCGDVIERQAVYPKGYQDACIGCHKVLGSNLEGWDSQVRNLAATIKSEPSGRWNEWALHWFGLDDFEIKVTE
jgi:hypothetical protein